MIEYLLTLIVYLLLIQVAWLMILLVGTVLDHEEYPGQHEREHREALIEAWRDECLICHEHACQDPHHDRAEQAVQARHDDRHEHAWIKHLYFDYCVCGATRDDF